MTILLRRPSAYLPIAMSLAVVLAGALEFARFGTLHQPDEGIGAHLFQILMPAQLPLVAFFAATWLRKAPSDARWILAVQIGLFIAIVATVFALRL